MFKYATAHCEAARKRRTHNSILSTSRAFEVFFFEETANVMTNALIASGFISGPWVRLFLTTGICEPLNKYGIEIARYNEKTQLIVLRDFEKINASGLRFNSETLRRDNVCHSRNLRTRINPVDWESAQSSLRIAHISYTALARNRHAAQIKAFCPWRASRSATLRLEPSPRKMRENHLPMARHSLTQEDSATTPATRMERERREATMLRRCATGSASVDERKARALPG
jgi:hypothetical protein